MMKKLTCSLGFLLGVCISIMASAICRMFRCSSLMLNNDTSSLLIMKKFLVV